MMPKTIKFNEGEKFGMLTIISYNGLTNHRTKRYTTWLCQCDCSNITVVTTARLRNGKTKSCGCSKQYALSIWTGYEEISGTYWKRIQNDAKKRKMSFNVSIEFAWELFLKQNRRCVLSNEILIFDRSYVAGNLQTASLDRINSSLGYEKNNVQWIHKDINRMKWNFSEEYFIDLCNKIATHQK